MNDDKTGRVIPGSIAFELTDEEIEAVRRGAKTVSPRNVVGGEGSFAIRNHAFADDKVVTLNLEPQLIRGPLTFELTDEEISAIKSGARQITPTHVVGGKGGFAIRNHAFAEDKVIKLNLDPEGSK